MPPILYTQILNPLSLPPPPQLGKFWKQKFRPHSIHKKDKDLRISAPHILRFDIALSPFDDAWQKLWLKNEVFDEILGCSGHFTLPEKKWAPVAMKISYKYDARSTLKAII